MVGTEEIAAVMKSKQSLLFPRVRRLLVSEGPCQVHRGSVAEASEFPVHRKEDGRTITELWATHSPPWTWSHCGGRWLERTRELLGGSRC